MKIKILSIVATSLLSTTIVFGQTNTFPASGDVGIGTTSPSANLDVRGKINSEKFQIRTPSTGLWFNITSINGSNRLDFNRVSNGDNPLVSILANGNVGVGTTSPFQKLQVHGKALIGSNNGAADIVDHLKFGNASGLFIGDAGSLLDNNNHGLNLVSRTNLRLFVNEAQGNAIEAVFIKMEDGNVGIGTTAPDSKLTVAGKIHAQEIKVTTTAGADFVFESDYPLRSLEETEQFIKDNKHLPDIPSAEEMVEEGITLGEMNVKLLQKIEELTLYVIEQEKQIAALKKENIALQSSQDERLQELTTRLQKLENEKN